MPSIIENLQKLIAIPSYPGDEKRIQDHIFANLDQAGLVPFTIENNVIVKIAGIDSSRALIFNSHSDVVDSGDESTWRFPPWDGCIEDGRIYGRGACDTKAGLVASMEFAKKIATSRPPTDVWFSYTVQEETDGLGARQFAHWLKDQGYLDQYKDRGVIITEPTELALIANGHRGNFFLSASVKGNSAHASRPDLIESHAILRMHGFLEEVLRANESWQKNKEVSEFLPPSITPTSIEANSASPNRTAEICSMVLDLRTVPGYHYEARVDLDNIARRYSVNLTEICSESPVGYTDPSSRLVRVLSQALPKARVGMFSAAADLGYFTAEGIDAIIFGPGSMDQAHQTDEFVELSQLQLTSSIFELMYAKWSKSD